MLFHDHRVPAATQSTIPAFCLSCKSVFRDSHHKVSFLKSSNITNKATRISFKQETKTLYNWKPFKPLLTRRNTEEVLRFFLLAAATHTTIQTPKHPCNLKKGEVDHKYGGLGSSRPEQNAKTPSRHRISASKVLWKKFKNLQKTPKNLLKLPIRADIEGQKSLSASRRWEEKTGRKGGKRGYAPPQSLNHLHLCTTALSRSAASLYMNIWTHIYGESAEKTEKEGTPSRGRPPHSSYKPAAR